MYSTVGIFKNAKFPDKVVGTHQKLDRVARSFLGKHLPKQAYFPSAKEIVYFEGFRGPDGLKIKSPYIDEPMHFIIPDHDDGVLLTYIMDHQYNLRQAIEDKNTVRAAFEAAWLSHAVVDGLTPAHHFPLTDVANNLMNGKSNVKLFGKPIKGVMRGDNAVQAARNNWLYWGAEGYMNRHVAFEYGVAVTVTAMANKTLMPKIAKKELYHVDLKTEFYKTLYRINDLEMYDRFCRSGWTTELALESKKILLPEITRMIVLAWASAVPALQDPPTQNKKKQ